mmetsp:Transcript_17504/g.29068  ORF Transcript_17504/g.29068 Transcript_17504/m.29068 type:complete len:277 (-) Transcript_17504:330-1160(-)
MNSDIMASPENLAVATRLHLGNASAPPSDEKYREMMATFYEFASSFGAKYAYVAVDATPKFDNYSLVEVIRSVTDNSDNSTTSPILEIIPVTPWNKFVPALNAIASRAATSRATHCLFCSAETQTSPESMLELLEYMDADTLVAGAVLPGHDYRPKTLQPLNGSTTPWNTLAIWNVAKLALTGFPLVADGLHTNPDGAAVAAGVEEVSAIALIQSILTPQRAKAKLVPLPDCEWNQTFEDEGRRKWHEAKMKSKVERPAKHLELLQLGKKGVVEHC